MTKKCKLYKFRCACSKTYISLHVDVCMHISEHMYTCVTHKSEVTLAHNVFPHVWGVVSPDYYILGLEL